MCGCTAILNRMFTSLSPESPLLKVILPSLKFQEILANAWWEGRRCVARREPVHPAALRAEMLHDKVRYAFPEQFLFQFE